MGIERVLPQNIGETSRWRAIQQHIAERKISWIVEHRGELGVDAVPAFPATSKKGSNRGIRMEHFTNGREPGVNFAQLAVPLFPKTSRDVRKCIDAIAVEPRDFRPPDAVLDQILH